MKKSLATVLIVLAAIAAIATPIVFSIYIARLQAVDAETNRVLAYARDVLYRSDSTARQVETGIALLNSIRSEDPCSDEMIDTMRRIDVSSSYLQAIGYIVDDRAVCSSMGRHDPGIPMGPVDLVTSRGATLRKNVFLPFSGESSFLALEVRGLAAIIHKSLPIDTTTNDELVSLATYHQDDMQLLTSRGVILPGWVNENTGQREITFFRDGYIVANIRSDNYLIGALAAVPIVYLNQRVRTFALFLVPIGLVAGLVLGYAVYSLARQQLSMPAVIKGGLKRDEFFLNYQPVVRLATGEWVGAEALIRWRRPAGNLVRPDIFIPVAEDSGLIKQITERAFKLVARDTDELFSKFPAFHIAINLSADDLISLGTIGLIEDLTRTTNVKHKNLIVEATERGFVDKNAAEEVISKIRGKGIQIAIDDFGTGYSSLSYLESLDVDILKIDKSFVDTIGIEAATSSVVTHIISMAKSLGLEMVAEGVETELQARFLREHGVQYAQGWLFGKPMGVGQLLDSLHEVRDRQLAIA